MINYLPKHNVTINKIFTDQKFIIDKICEILFTKKYNDYCVKIARSVLDFLSKARFITWKQAKLIQDLKPKK